MSGASRADYAISCASAGSTKVSWGNGPSAVAATIEAGSFGSGSGSVDMDLGSAPAQPVWLSGLTDVDADGTLSISMSAVKINGKTWDEDVPLGKLEYNKVYEWTIGGSNAHPYHQHIYHMLIVQPGGCGPHIEGEFYDTISTSGNCRVRFRTANFGQRMVLVCTSHF